MNQGYGAGRNPNWLATKTRRHNFLNMEKSMVPLCLCGKVILVKLKEKAGIELD